MNVSTLLVFIKFLTCFWAKSVMKAGDLLRLFQRTVAGKEIKFSAVNGLIYILDMELLELNCFYVKLSKKLIKFTQN